VFTALFQFPKIPAAVHFSGPVWYWIERRHGEFFMLVNTMLRRKQLELLSGGYYEPLFPIINHNDRLGQTELLTTYLRRHFGKRCRGSLVPESAWDTELPSLFSACGFSYALIDESGFADAGVPKGGLYRPRISEDKGKTVVLFPVLTHFADSFAENPGGTIERLLRARGGAGDDGTVERVLCVFPKHLNGGIDTPMPPVDTPDTEAAVPDTAPVVPSDVPTDNANGQVMPDLEPSSPAAPAPSVSANTPTDTANAQSLPGSEQSAPVNTPDAGDSAKEKKPEKPVHDAETLAVMAFLSEISRYEGKIAFSTPSNILHGLTNLEKIYLPQRNVKSVLVSRPEINNIYSKMVFVRGLIDMVRGDKTRKQLAYREMWKAQDITLYDGSPGGTETAPAVRNAAFTALLEAETMARGPLNWKSAVTVHDFDFDGVDEYLFHGALINCFIHRTGGSVFELDYLPCNWNYCGAAGARRVLFGDSLYPADYSPLSPLIPFDDGITRFCWAERWTPPESVDRPKMKLRLTLPAAGSGGFASVEIEKTFFLKGNTLQTAYRLSNTGENGLDFLFVPEMNFSFPCGETEDLRIYCYGEYESFTKNGEKKKVDADCRSIESTAAIDFQDIKNEAIVNLKADKRFSAWVFPQSGTEDCRQSTRVMPYSCVRLKAKASFNIKFSLSFYK
jgi:hypothetical protein